MTTGLYKIRQITVTFYKERTKSRNWEGNSPGSYLEYHEDQLS